VVVSHYEWFTDRVPHYVSRVIIPAQYSTTSRQCTSPYSLICFASQYLPGVSVREEVPHSVRMCLFLLGRRSHSRTRDAT
jgi:hypothetical protein